MLSPVTYKVLLVIASLSVVISNNNNNVIVSGLTLNDDPIVGDGMTSLDGVWTASSSSAQLSIPAQVPGDLLSDLETAHIIGNPYYELNFLNFSIWNNHVWNYTKTFHHATLPGQSSLLVFDGVKMGARVYLNGNYVNLIVDQFKRYVFDATKFLTKGSNTLVVSFDPQINVNGRFMACTGGWDWAPYSQTQNFGANSFSKGIWKSVYIVETASVAIAHVTPHVFYKGSYPTSPLSPHNHGDFDVLVRMEVWAPSTKSVELNITSEWGRSNYTTVTAQQGYNEFEVLVAATASDIELWWTWELGSQKLYNVTVNAAIDDVTLTATRRIGFRVFALVTGNDTDPAYVQKNLHTDGTDTQGMLFRLNGAVVFARGANMIPMDEMEGRLDAEAHYRLVQSAKGGGMNILRVWGGGIFLPQIWYDACDEQGILVYHDMQYAQSGHSPSNDSTQADELRHQIRRLSHHPSIALWDGCNECHVVIGTPTGIYATFVMKIVEEEDMSHVIWPSCPAEGWTSGVNRLTALPNGSPLGLLPRATAPTKLKPSMNGVGRKQKILTTSLPKTTCSYVANTDIDDTLDWLHPTAATKEDCCSVCVGDISCFAAVFYDGSCWFKNDTRNPVYREGRVACLPPGVGPLPPAPPSPPPPPSAIETHGPYQHGSGFPSVNGANDLAMFDPNIPISLTPVKTGPEYYNVFASEFGCVVMSSFESMSPTLSPDHWSVHGGSPPDTCTGGFAKECKGDNVMAQRNYPCDSIIFVYFGQYDLDPVGENAFKKQLYHCMIGQALEMKSNIETRRGTNQFGIMIWQLNEIWPTGGWGSLEYGTPGQEGQVIGGRWKPLHYWLRSSVFADVMAACDGNGVCYVKNDIARAFVGSVSIESVPFSDDSTVVIHTHNVSLAVGAGITEWFNVDLSSLDFNNTVLRITTTSSAGSVMSTNIQALAIPANMALQKANVQFSVSETANADGSINIVVSTDHTAMYVTLTTLAHGRFSDNAVLLAFQEQRTISFIPFEKTTPQVLAQSLRVEHVASYL
eukprot:m.47003 g.47003  ORF g.47003 m.47003 type:complete len:1028 (-) comp7303_c0_seq1:128-3211(-)